MENTKITMDSFHVRLKNIQDDHKEQINNIQNNYTFISDTNELQTTKEIDVINHLASLDLYSLYIDLLENVILSDEAKELKQKEFQTQRKEFKDFSEKALDNIISKGKV